MAPEIEASIPAAAHEMAPIPHRPPHKPGGKIVRKRKQAQAAREDKVLIHVKVTMAT